MIGEIHRFYREDRIQEPAPVKVETIPVKAEPAVPLKPFLQANSM
jgi:hypothetical protein